MVVRRRLPSESEIVVAVARGLSVSITRNPEAERLLRGYYKDRINLDRLSMADLPDGSSLIDNPVTMAPGFKIANIYVFAGIPSIMHAMFENIKNELHGIPQFEKEMNLKVGEGEVARFMKIINREFPLVELGSYPTLEVSRGYKTQLVFKAPSQEMLVNAVTRFCTLLGISEN